MLGLGREGNECGEENVTRLVTSGVACRGLP
jgi:hypothetical protein